MNSPTDPTGTRYAAAKVRVQRALRHIQAAQDHLGQASAELGAVRFGAPTQRSLMRIYDKVHAEWYRVQKLLDNFRIELDREPNTSDLDPRGEA
jgi:hypothetical protein